MAIENCTTKQCRDCGEIKPLNAFSKKLRGILGVRPECNVCRSTIRRSRYAEDEEFRIRKRDSDRKYRQKNKQINRLRATAWRLANPLRHYEKKQAWVEANSALMAQYKNEWRKRNPHIVNAATARRAAAKIKATPGWANSFFIAEAYHLARLRTTATGILWEVDHLIPLRSKTVCGLHAENNLQLLPASENRKKSNRYWPDK
jgi:hypothetical protein